MHPQRLQRCNLTGRPPAICVNSVSAGQLRSGNWRTRTKFLVLKPAGNIRREEVLDYGNNDPIVLRTS